MKQLNLEESTYHSRAHCRQLIGSHGAPTGRREARRPRRKAEDLIPPLRSRLPGATQARHARTINSLLLALFVSLFSVTSAVAFDLDSSHVIFAFPGVDTSSHLGEFINGIGDVNGDGFSDIAVSSFEPRGTYIFYGGNPPDTIPDMFIRGTHGPAIAVDVTGDGIKDVVVADVVGPLTSETGTILFYEGHIDSLDNTPFDSIATTEQPNGALGYWLKTADIDGDGRADLLTNKPTRFGGDELLLYFGAPSIDTVADWVFTSPLEQYNFFDMFGFIDFNGDGEQDIFVGLSPRSDTAGALGVFFGPEFGTAPDVLIEHPEHIGSVNPRFFPGFVSNVGDFDGDGWDDLVVHFSEQLIYCCGPGADTVYDYSLQYSAKYTAGKMDVNHDGYNDLVSGGAHLIDGAVDVYLGGPRADEWLDDFIYRGNLPPWLLNRVGYRTASAGDFNGDGIDDFLFSSSNDVPWTYGAAFVAKGSQDIVVDVPLDSTVAVATDDLQFTAYPNPF
ncbi:hypothetical protein GF377_11225, partial [candidate division GN15 bacterium]|nr:hypothetical protein [candidate division GN15 bacterium]